jgi:2,3-bisphosphoglycerate-independent phosphoglycerate mutase
MGTPDIPGATGYIDTNFEGKANAALQSLQNGCDLAYIHIEAPDECGHRREAQNKVRSIELIDERVLPVLFEGLRVYDDYKIMVLPDHPTPIVTATHTSDPVPYLIYQKNKPQPGMDSFTETAAKATGRLVEHGPQLMKIFLGNIESIL